MKVLLELSTKMVVKTLLSKHDTCLVWRKERCRWSVGGGGGVFDVGGGGGVVDGTNSQYMKTYIGAHLLGQR